MARRKTRSDVDDEAEVITIADSADDDGVEETMAGSAAAAAANDDDDDDDDDDAESLTEMPEDNLASPEASWKDMSLRSGKKKRRRSRGTTGLTPPTQTTNPAKRQRKSTRSSRRLNATNNEVAGAQGDPQDEDDGMQGTQDELDGEEEMEVQGANGEDGDGPDEDGDQKMPATADNDEEDASADPAEQQQANKAVNKLRMPSQHTPGNLHETAVLPSAIQNAPHLQSTKRLLFSGPNGNGNAPAASHDDDESPMKSVDDQDALDAAPTSGAYVPMGKVTTSPLAASTAANGKTAASSATQGVTVHRYANGDGAASIPSASSMQAQAHEGASTINDEQSKLSSSAGYGNGRFATQNSGDNLDDDDDDLLDEDYEMEEYEDEDELSPIMRTLSKTSTWIIVLLVLQILFYKFWVHPIMTSVTSSAHFLIGAYRFVLMQRSAQQANNATITTPITAIDQEPVIEQPPMECQSSDIFQMLDELETKSATVLGERQQTIHAEIASVTQYADQLTIKRHDQERIISEQRQKLETIRDALQDAINADFLDDATWMYARELVDQANDNMPKWKLIDTLNIPLWDVADPPDCPDDEDEIEIEDEEDDMNDDVDAVPITEEDLVDTSIIERRVRELRLMAKQTSVQIRRTSKIPDTIREEVTEFLEEMNLIQLVEEASANLLAVAGNSMIMEEAGGVDQRNIPDDAFAEIDDVKERVQHLIDVERADRTGEIDFASIIVGAKVIRSGPYRTSTSLVESLPVGNRIMALLGLRFYGYGPEAALVPTYPVHSIGQCWSFRPPRVVSETEQRKMRLAGALSHDDNSSVDGGYQGMFGTLSVQLARPIHVTSIVLEHPPEEATGQFESAIRDARIMGYESSDASGKPWHIGSVNFDPRQGDLQEYTVATEIGGNTEVPPLASITLAIDSNWGNSYACLYRFRVHGMPPSSVEE